MSVLVVGSVALDSIETPFGKAERVLGGSAVYFGASASLFTKVRVVAVVGDDYPTDQLDFLKERGVDFSGVETAEGESFFWAGKYSDDLSSRETLETRLGVFGDFHPQIPESFQDSDVVFLGNIDPVLQLQVLDQVKNPKLVAADTMNYWIDGDRDTLLELVKRIDILFLNDEEARQLSGESNLTKAARWLRNSGPDIVVIKKGEHGAILFAPDGMFFIPGYPLEEIFDPTGAGDCFAGGFIGYLDWVGRGINPEDLRRAMVYGSTMGSYAVEAFSVDRFKTLTPTDVSDRVRLFREMTTFEESTSQPNG